MATQPRHLHRLLAFLDPLLCGTPLVVEPHHRPVQPSSNSPPGTRRPCTRPAVCSSVFPRGRVNNTAISRSRRRLRAIPGSTSSSQSLALCTLPGRSFCRQAIAFPIEQQQRGIAGGHEVAVVDALLLCVHRISVLCMSSTTRCGASIWLRSMKTNPA